MKDTQTLLKFLDELAAITVERRRAQATVAVAVVATRTGRKIVFVERTYRPGVCFILDPTPEELCETCEGDPWKIWNSERAVCTRSEAAECSALSMTCNSTYA